MVYYRKKIFLTTGVLSGLFMGIVDSLEYGIVYGIVSGIISGFIFGGIMAIVLGNMHRKSVKLLLRGENSPGNFEESLGVCHVRNLEIDLPFDEVFNLCIDSLELIKKCKVMKEDRVLGNIIAKAGMTRKTWGDLITFNLRKNRDGRILIELSSRPSWSLTVVDFGKNLENIEIIVNYIKIKSGKAV